MIPEQYEIPFTQYILPDGAVRPNTFLTHDRAVYDKAMEIIAAGLAFEVELLTTGDVSATIVKDGEDVAIDMFPNDPGVEQRINTMIRNFKLEEHTS